MSEFFQYKKKFLKLDFYEITQYCTSNIINLNKKFVK